VDWSAWLGDVVIASGISCLLLVAIHRGFASLAVLPFFPSLHNRWSAKMEAEFALSVGRHAEQTFNTI
jgi:hypothetical protein